MDKIKIKNLEVFAHHGVLKEENVLGQKFIISITMYTDIIKAGTSDELQYSINYAEVSQFVTEYMQAHTHRLLETVAEQLSKELLLHFTTEHVELKKVKLEIKKPWAPVLLPLETVSVQVKRKWHTAYLGIGSNLGDKEENLRKAMALLEQDKYCRVTKVSDFIITKPVGEVEQDDFLNGALEVKTLYHPEELLELIGKIEKELKRVRLVHWGPRTIDLDILLYDNQIYHSKDLTIPHKEMHKRAFVLEPMAKIAPLKVHPVKQKTMQELLEEVGNGF